MSLLPDQVTANNFKDFYDKIKPYLNYQPTMGFTPVGTIISIMGTHAPAHYLVCDGTVYNIADHVELANYFKEQFGSYNHFGGDGTTTFAVPDLRGEFLRGTGTNSHENQGNGANVGVHQDGTEYTITGTSYEGGKDYLSIPHNQTINGWNGYTNADATRGTGTNAYIAMSANNTNSRVVFAASRPTNTSVLYCIASRNIYLKPENDYSTDEKVVGTWIDGKPIYQKTLSAIVPNNTSSFKYDIRSNIPNCDGIIKYDVNVYVPPGSDSTTFYSLNYNNVYASTTGAEFKGDNKKGRSESIPLILEFSNTFASLSATFYITTQYTKITD